MGYHWKNETILSTSISLEFYLHNWKSSPGYTVPTLLARRMEQLRSPMWTWTSWMDKLHVLKLWMVRQWREPVRPSRYITLLKKTSSLYFRGYKRLSFVTHDVPLATLWSTKWKSCGFVRPTGLVQPSQNMLTLSWRKVPNFDPLLQICWRTMAVMQLQWSFLAEPTCMHSK